MAITIRAYTTASERRKALEKNQTISLPHIGNFSQEEEQLAKKNCENMIGYIRVPIGIAGPLQVQSDTEDLKEYYLPLATTEGALVASVSRGCKAISMSGGAKVTSKRMGISRAPVFAVNNIYDGAKFIEWVAKQYEKLKEITESTSRHLTLIDIRPWQIGRSVFFKELQD